MEKFKLTFLKAKIRFPKLSPTNLGLDTPTTPSQLPLSISTQINQRIADLSSHPDHQTTVQSALKEALNKWRQQPEAPNSLVILASPVSPLTRILSESASGFQEDNVFQVKSLEWAVRPHEYNKIKTQLLSQFNPKEALPKTTDLVTSVTEKSEDVLRLLVISRLEWCFLRCIGGLEVIEILRDLISSDASQFWLIGCNNWAWQYLEQIYQVSAYFGETQALPALTGTQIKEWLQPIIDEINLNWGEDLAQEDLDSYQEQYFENLADISVGIGTVGADLWMRGLQYPASETDNLQAQGEVLSSLTIQKPKLPDLPNLIPEDRFLLYSLLLHGGMSLSHLALSLGQTESLVKTRVRFLLQTGVIRRENNLLIVNPSYYPRLKMILKNNNFLVDE